MDKTYEQQNREYLELFSTDKLNKVFVDYFADTQGYWLKDLKDYLESNNPEVLRGYLIKTLSDDRMFMLSELEEIFTTNDFDII